MAENRVKVLRATDRAVISFFEKLAGLVGCYDVSIIALGFVDLGRMDISEGRPEELEELFRKNSKIIDTVTLHLNGMPVIYHRGGGVKHEDKSPIYDEILLRKNDRAPEELDRRVVYDIVDLINRKFKFPPGLTRSGSESDPNTEFDAVHAATVERLEQLSEDLINKTHEYRESLDRKLDERRGKLEEELEKEKERVWEGVERKEAELEERRERLEELRKSIDDKNNTHARREIRKDILREIKSRQEKFSLTEGTNNMRKPIQGAMWLLVVIFVSLGVVSSFEFYNVAQGDDFKKIILFGLKQTVYFGGAVASIIFMIRWMNKWFDLHSQSEFELKSFELDMERASWLVETSLEWKDAKDNVIPPELLESLSRNLFSKDEGDEDKLEHPADQLASALMGSASNVRLKSGDSVVEIDPKKLRKSKDS